MTMRVVHGLFLVAATSGCGGFSEDPGEPTVLATVEGEISVPAGMDPPESLRVAMVWRGSTFNVAQELDVVPQFPARFRLEIDGLPPEDAFYVPRPEEGTPQGMRAASGSVVGYVDQNGNDRLDMVDIGAESYVDQLVATNHDRLVIYVEATAAALDAFEQQFGVRPPRGFSFLDTAAPPEAQILPLSTPYDLRIDPDPRLNEQMCRTGVGDDAPSGHESGQVHREPPEVYPSPGDPSITCSTTGDSYKIGSCTESPTGPCRQYFKDCTYDYWLRPVPIPPGWPCPEG